MRIACLGVQATSGSPARALQAKAGGSGVQAESLAPFGTEVLFNTNLVKRGAPTELHLKTQMLFLTDFCGADGTRTRLVPWTR